MTGRNSQFEAFFIKKGGEKMMEVKPNSRKEYEFGLAAKTCHTEVKVGSREFQADMFNALQVAGGTMIKVEIKDNQRIVCLVTVDGREHQLNMKRMKSFKDEDRITSKNWLSWIVPGIKELHYTIESFYLSALLAHTVAAHCFCA